MPAVSVPTHVSDLFRLCVRSLVCWTGFPSASPLPSTSSAGRSALQPLFGSFPGTMRLSDFPRSFITVVLPRDSQHGPQDYLLRSNVGPPGSRARSLRACSGSLTTQGPAISRDCDMTDIAFRFFEQRRHPRVTLSRLNVPACTSPVNASPITLRL